MFKRKYTISIIDCKWNPIKRNLNFEFIPKRDELIYIDEKYLTVINVIHSIGKKQDIFIVVEELTKKNDTDNQQHSGFSKK